MYGRTLSSLVRQSLHRQRGASTIQRVETIATPLTHHNNQRSIFIHRGPTPTPSSLLTSPSSLSLNLLRHSPSRTFSRYHPSDHGFQEFGDRPGPNESLPRIRIALALAGGAIIFIGMKYQANLRRAQRAEEATANNASSNPAQTAPTKSSTPSIIEEVKSEPAALSQSSTYPPDLVDLHRDARSIFEAALEAADPKQMIQRVLKLEQNGGRTDLVLQVSPGRSLRYSLEHFHRITLIACGKASIPMAEAAAQLLNDKIDDGVVITKTDHSGGKLTVGAKLKIIEAGHPLPNEESIRAGQAVTELLSAHSNDPRTLVLVLLSGGGSSLLVQPSGTLQLHDIQAANQALIRSGMNISDINFVRKHMDSLKGGGLLQHAGQSQVLSLILSDVVGDDLNDIASGPTVPFTRDYGGVIRRLEQYHLRPSRLVRDERRPHDQKANHLPITVYEHLLQGTKEQLLDQRQQVTQAIPLAWSASEAELAPPSSSSSGTLSSNVTNVLIGSNRHSLIAAAKRAESLGYEACLLTDRLEGEAASNAKWLSSVAIPVLENGLKPGQQRPRAFIAGGETVVTFDSNSSSNPIGLGGRNQEFALAAAIHLNEYESSTSNNSASSSRTVILSAGTDGSDGPTDATGAIVDSRTVTRGESIGLRASESLQRHDSYQYFHALDQHESTNTNIPPSHIKTGPTGTNVADIYLALTR